MISFLAALIICFTCLIGSQAKWYPFNDKYNSKPTKTSVNSEQPNNPTSSKKESSADKNASQKQQRPTTVRGSSYSFSNSRNLEKIIKELEESDYGSFGSWGNFVSRKNPRKQAFANDNKLEDEFEIINIDDDSTESDERSNTNNKLTGDVA